MTRSLDRLIRPQSIAVFGGKEARRVIEQCDKMGFIGDIDLILFETTPKPVEKAIRRRAGALADFIRSNLDQTRLHGLDFGPHQMTCIRDLKVFWGRGAHVDVRPV